MRCRPGLMTRRRSKGEGEAGGGAGEVNGRDKEDREGQ